MIKFNKEQNNFVKGYSDIEISDNNSKLSIFFGGDDDLYWSIIDKNIKPSHDFPQKIYINITKENYALYTAFDNLYEDIKNINITDRILTDIEKKRYAFNDSYKELFSNNRVTWYSDEAEHEFANYLIINKLNDVYNVEFYTQPYEKNNQYEFRNYNRISIKICNSGSRYKPFNVIFMKMYNSLFNMDDAYEKGHQIHFEEYLFNKNKVLCRK